MPDEIERELEAFGLTLEERAGEPIRPGSDDLGSSAHGRSRRWWALGGAAACVVAVIAALAVANRPSGDEPVASPAPTTTTTATTTATTGPADVSVEALVPDDPLGLVRDGWTHVQRTTDPFEFAADELPCPTTLEELTGVRHVYDVVTPPDIGGLEVEIGVLEVGSPPRGNLLADGVQMIGRCLAEQEEVEVATTSLSAIRATWFRAGPEFALATVVGEGNLSIVLEIEGAVFTDFLIADLAHRADQFLRGVEVTGAPADTPVGTTTIVAQEGPFVERGPGVGEAPVEPQPGDVKLWVSNQSFIDDPVTMIVLLDGIPVVSETLFVEGQHNWQSFLISGLAPGEHTVTAERITTEIDSVVTASWSFTLPDDEARWLVVDYWYDPDDPEGRRFTFHESDQPVAFS